MTTCILSICSFTEVDYLETYAENPSDIYSKSSVDGAMSNAYAQTRKFLMAMYSLTEAEANTIITQGVDFAVTQVVDGNWGVHSVIPKSVFEPYTMGDTLIDVETDAVAAGRAGPTLEEADLKLSAANVHWGFFSKELDPVLTVTSGQEVIVEMATHHAVSTATSCLLLSVLGFFVSLNPSICLSSLDPFDDSAMITTV